jgi:hypothetical protein
MKYELKQTIHYMRDNRPHSATVLARKCVENLHDDWICTEEQKKTFTPYGVSGVVYSTCHGEVDEKDAFASKEEMVRVLCGA